MNDRIVMPVWATGFFIIIMNTTMFNVSIPGIIDDLGITADLGSWVISSYSIGYALSTVIYSRLSDTVPLRKLLAIGLTILGLASVFGLFAGDFRGLLAARILQSLGAGAMAGLGLVMASRYIPADRRGRAISMISGGSAMAFGLGPIVGGVVSEYFGWNGLFGVTCLVLAILPVLLKLLPREEAKPFRFDAVGATLTVANATTLLLAVTQLSWSWLAASLASFAIHAWHTRRASEPFIQAKLLRQTDYLRLLAIGFCIVILNLGNLFLMPLVLARIFGLSAMKIGLLIAPGAIVSALLTRFVGRWIDRYGNMRFLLTGHAVLAIVLALFSAEASLSPAVILCGYLLFSPAFSATLSSLNNETTFRLPGSQIGAGMGLLQMIQFFGGSVSVAVCGLLLEAQDKLSPELAFGRVYEFLLAMCLVSSAFLLSYRRSSRKPASA